MTELKQKKQNRFLFLKKMYEESNGSSNAVFYMKELGKELQLQYDEVRQIVDYLINEGLVEYYGAGGTIQLTHWGIKEVEEALENPDKPTEHFLPFNIINIGTMTNSNLQQGSHNSSLTINYNSKQLTELETIIERVKQIESTLELSVEMQKELISEIETLQSQKKSPKPKNVIISESLKTIRTLLEGVTTNVMTIPVIDMITKFLNN